MSRTPPEARLSDLLPVTGSCSELLPRATRALRGVVGPLTGVLMSHVDFKKRQCRMSLSLDIALVPCRI